MGKQSIGAVTLVVIACLGAWAAEWTETDSGADIVVDAGTGLPAVVFHVSLEVDAPLTALHVGTSWEVFAFVDGRAVPIEGASTTSVRTGESHGIYTASPRVLIEPGGRYEARVEISDPANDLAYERTFEFVAPTAVPFGIRLEGWDGSDEVDLSRLPDEELEELVLLHDLLGSYRETARGVEARSFLQGDGQTSEYPLSLLLLPTVAIDTSGSRAPIEFSVVFSLYVYALSAPGEASGVASQIRQFDQDLVGTVFAGSGSAILGGGRTIFVHDRARQILDAASVELAAR